jgi:hypothetical protein
LVQREALVLTYNDAIMLLGDLFVAALVLMLLVRRPRATIEALRRRRPVLRGGSVQSTTLVLLLGRRHRPSCKVCRIADRLVVTICSL